MTLFLMICAPLSSLALSGCASRPTTMAPPKPLQATVPSTLRRPCPRAEVGALKTVSDEAALSVRQENALNTCEQQRDQAVSIIDDLNLTLQALDKALAPKPFWRIW
jgi:hypothetical protein